MTNEEVGRRAIEHFNNIAGEDYETINEEVVVKDTINNNKFVVSKIDTDFILYVNDEELDHSEDEKKIMDIYNVLIYFEGVRNES